MRKNDFFRDVGHVRDREIWATWGGLIIFPLKGIKKRKLDNSMVVYIFKDVHI